MLWKYPLPDNIGLKIDRASGLQVSGVFADSAATASGIKVGEDIVRMNGQRMTSIADMQWVLHHLPSSETFVTIECSASGEHKEGKIANQRGP
jgi:serine protease Do